MKLIVRVAQRLAIQLPVRTVFNCPTIREMAQAIEMLLPEVPLTPVSAATEYEESVI
jgi:hypothetical protein